MTCCDRRWGSGTVQPSVAQSCRAIPSRRSLGLSPARSQTLRELRRNDDEDLRELEELDHHLEILKTAIVDVETGKAPQVAAERSASSFGTWLRNWFDKHDQVAVDAFNTMNGAARTGLFLSAIALVGVCP